MIGAISGVGTYYNPYQYGYGNSISRAQPNQAAQAQNLQRTGGTSGVLTAQRAAMPETPVQPVRPVTPTSANASQPAGLGLPIREGADPVEMAVRMRIQYADPADPAQQNAQAAQDGKSAQGAESAQAADDGKPALGAESAQAAAEEGQCQTCAKRKYQDGSDDPGVSFKTPTHIAPDQAASAVRGHEMEHVVREQSKAQREDRKVVNQSVTYHTAICPECGKVYISGGTTRTTTAANTDQQTAGQQEQKQGQDQRVPFSAVA